MSSLKVKYNLLNFIVPSVGVLIFIYANILGTSVSLTILTIFAYLLCAYIFLSYIREGLIITDDLFVYTPSIGRKKEWLLSDISSAEIKHYNKYNQLIIYDKANKKLCVLEGYMKNKPELIEYLKENYISIYGEGQ